MENNLIDIFKDIHTHFIEYLTEHGRVPDGAGFINCINPSHPDRNPSMHIVDEGHGANAIAHCFSCLADYNIFHAANIFENKPLNGPGFYEDTLVHLCKKYNIPYEPIKISDDTKREYQRRRAYQDAATIVHSNMFNKGILRTEHPAVQHLLTRGIKEETIKKFKIGCINSFADYIKQMAERGWTDREYLNQIDLATKGIFNKDGIIIPINDEKNRVVGFVTRTTKMEPNDKGTNKYINSMNSDIYHKGEVLFNFNNYDKKKGPLLIVEGYLDSVFLSQEGMDNAAAIGATILTDEHINMLINNKVKDIILCLDGDDGGRRGVEYAIEKAAPYKIFNLRIMELPENSDPDSYVRQYGLKAFTELSQPNNTLLPFFWTLKQSTFEDDPMETAKKAIPTIAAEDSNITRLQMIKQLARLTGISEIDIKKDVDGLVNKESNIYLQELSEIGQFVSINISRRRPQDYKQILNEAVLKVKNLERLYDNRIDNRTEFDDRYSNIVEKLRNGEMKRGLITPNFKRLEMNLDGLPYWSCLTAVGGRPSAGKTTYLTALGIDIIENNPDAALFYMSIDDTTELMILKMLAMKTGLSTTMIKRYTELPLEDKLKVDDAWDWFNTLKERFILSDASSGNTPEALEAHIEWFDTTFKDYKQIILLDNFHKLRLPNAGRNGKTEAVSELSQRIKDITQVKDKHIIMTVELRKMDGSDSRPQVQDLKDSVQIEYDADIILMTHNDLQVNDKSMVVWNGVAGDNGIKQMPFIEVYLRKNKITGIVGGPIMNQLNSYNLQTKEAEDQKEAKERVYFKSRNSLNQSTPRTYG